MGDVAKLAGVSQQTVSRVVNAREYVSGHTRERVLSAMRELNYRPNPAAQALVTGRSKTLGVISVDSIAFGPASVLLGLERAAHAYGYFVSVARLASPDRRSVLQALEQLQRQNVEGILVNAGQDGITRELDRRLIDVPLVAIDDTREAVVPVVAVDQVSGAAGATRLLLDLGHRTVSHIAGARDWSSARRRIEGWRAVLESAEVPVAPPLFGDWSVRSGYELGRLLAQDREVTAIFAANDEMALGVMRAMAEAGREVPRDVSIIGFDDVPFARYLTPPLTTVRQDFEGLGQRSVHLLMDAIHGVDDSCVQAVITTELVKRGSTAPAVPESGSRNTPPPEVGAPDGRTSRPTTAEPRPCAAPGSWSAATGGTRPSPCSSGP
jgi:DNA-binding LacI/PurR family transcriptional regulator